MESGCPQGVGRGGVGSDAAARGTHAAAPAGCPAGAVRNGGRPGGDAAGQPKRSIRMRSTGWPAATSSLEACSAKELEPHT